MTDEGGTLVSRTARLELHRATADTDVTALLGVFNSNPDWVAAENNFAGGTSYDASDVEMYLWQGIEGAGSTCLEIRDNADGELIGALSWMAPHPRDHCPWLGSLIIHSGRQHQGLAQEALDAVERLLSDEGWEKLRTSPWVASTRARAFFASAGYLPVEERTDQDKRPCIVLEKRLSGAAAHSVASKEPPRGP